MQRTPLAAAVDGELKHSARLDIVTPWALPDAAKSIVAEAIAGEAWLERLGLLGIVTGLTDSNMRTFRSSVERLAGMLRYAKQEGERIAYERNVMTAAQMAEEARALAARAWLYAAAGFFAGGALVGAIFSFF